MGSRKKRSPEEQVRREKIREFLRKRVPRGKISPLGFPLHFRGVGYPCCQIAAWMPRPENANTSTVLHPQRCGGVTARLEHIRQLSSRQQSRTGLNPG